MVSLPAATIAYTATFDDFLLLSPLNDELAGRIAVYSDGVVYAHSVASRCGLDGTRLSEMFRARLRLLATLASKPEAVQTVRQMAGLLHVGGMCAAGSPRP